MLRNRLWRSLLCLLTGAALSLALPPFGFWPVMLVGLPLWMWLMDTAPGRDGGYRRFAITNFITGWLIGFGYFFASLLWIGEAFLVEAETYAALLPLAISALPAGMAIYWGLAAGLASLFRHPSGIGRYVWFSVSFTAMEWLRAHLFSGFPWNNFATILDASLPLAQMLVVTGVYGAIFFICLWSLAPLLAIEIAARRNRGAAGGLLLIGVVSLALVYGFGQRRLADAPAPADAARHSDIHIRIVQPNIAQAEKWQPENRGRIFQTMLQLSQQGRAIAAGHRLVIIWPESSVPFLFDEDRNAVAQAAALLRPSDWLLAGAIYRRADAAKPSGESYYNAIQAVSPQGFIAARYDKRHLVPFGEYLPLERFLAPLGLRKLVTLPSSFAAGANRPILQLPGLPGLAPLVCYEAIFPYLLKDVSNTAGWLVNVTNDAWFGSSNGPWQHLAQAKMRAIETGLPLYRAANTGISAVIDPYGRIIKFVELNRAGTLQEELLLPAPASTASANLLYILVVLIISAVGLCLYELVRGKHAQN